ncbi:MAG: amidohydrolase family protein, partial [Rhabdochlamydiaceae bacterium]
METVSAIDHRNPSGKFRRVKGGLDNAVKQANERNLNEFQIIDTDCHQEEPFNYFLQYMSPEMQEIAKQKYATPDPEADPRLALADYQGDGGLRELGGRIRRPELGRTPMKPEVLIDTFASRMQDIGIKHCVVLPTFMLSLGFDTRKEFEVAMSSAYIQYMKDNFLGKYPEILSMVYAPANSPEKAAELIHTYGSAKGVVGIMISTGRSTSNLAGNDSWLPIYEAAEAKNLPICFHANPYEGAPFDGLGKFVSVHALSFPFYLILQLTSVVMSGMVERFPKVRFCFMEGGVSWIPWIMHRLDTEY